MKETCRTEQAADIFFCSDTLFANPITWYFTCNYAMFKCNQNLDMPGKNILK